jgi:hypothetical protein
MWNLFLAILCDMLEFILKYSNMLVAIFTAIAAGAAWWTAYQTKNIVKADVVLQIRKHLDQLPIPRDFDLESISILREGEDDIYREMVKNYYNAFNIIMCLIITKTIDEKTVRNIITPFELNAFLKVINPLEHKLKVLTDDSAFRFFKKF